MPKLEPKTILLFSKTLFGC